MIVIDTSFVPMPGQNTETIAASKEHLAYVEQHWPSSTPRQLWIETTGELGRIHVIAMKDSLAEHERSMAEQLADAHNQALGQKVYALMVPGSYRSTHLRTV